MSYAFDCAFCRHSYSRPDGEMICMRVVRGKYGTGLARYERAGTKPDSCGDAGQFFEPKDAFKPGEEAA